MNKTCNVRTSHIVSEHVALRRRVPHHLHRRRRLPENLPLRRAYGGDVELVEVGGSRGGLQRVGVGWGVAREARADGPEPEPELVGGADGEDLGIGEVWCPGGEAHGGRWGRGRRGPSDPDTDAPVVVDLRVGVERVPTVEGDDVIVDLEFSYGGGGLAREPGSDQDRGGSVFEEEEE